MLSILYYFFRVTPDSWSSAEQRQSMFLCCWCQSWSREFIKSLRMERLTNLWIYFRVWSRFCCYFHRKQNPNLQVWVLRFLLVSLIMHQDVEWRMFGTGSHDQLCFGVVVSRWVYACSCMLACCCTVGCCCWLTVVAVHCSYIKLLCSVWRDERLLQSSWSFHWSTRSTLHFGWSSPLRGSTLI